MSLDTLCLSIYSDISNLNSFTFKTFANTFAISVFPTPVGPTNKYEPIVFSSSLNPDLDSLTTLHSSFIALS